MKKGTPQQRKLLLKRLQQARAKRRVTNTPTAKRRLIRTRPTASINKKKRKINPQQRKLLLKRLAKARKVRMRNLRKR